MAAEEEGKCAVVVPQPPGFADRLFVLVLLKFPHRALLLLLNLVVFHGDHSLMHRKCD